MDDVFKKWQIALLREPYDPDRFQPAGPPRPGWAGHKPSGGLWFSPAPHGQKKSVWYRWCVSERFQLGTLHAYRIAPTAPLRVYRIDSYADLERLCERYSGPPETALGLPRLDWRRLISDYDALYVTAQGERATRLSQPYSLYGWDCESGVLFRTEHVRLEPLGVIDVPDEGDDDG